MATKNDITDSIELEKQLTIRQARKSFWTYCKTIRPKFYKDDRLYLKNMCDTLQALYERTLLDKEGTPYDRLMINAPPTFGKSFTVILFCSWCFGKDINHEVMSVSYNSKVSTKFATKVRDIIEEQTLEISYSDIFPATKIKHGDASKGDWALEGIHHSYLATSFDASMASFHATIGVIDDPVKGPEIANNEQELEDQWTWYTDSFLQRLKEGGLQIVIQTRWALKDLCGRLLSCEPELWYVLKLEAMNEITGEMLCPEIMSKKTYDHKLRRTSTPIFIANYHQETMDVKGRLIESYTSYGGPDSTHELPDEFDKIYAQIDTADKGADATVCIAYGIKDKLAYILDIFHSTAPMHVTESKVAEFLNNNCVGEVDTEGNNGGEGYSRQLQRLIRANHHNYQCKFNTFHQKKNKIAKILSNATVIQQDIIFPYNWNSLWPAAYHEVISFQRNKRNAHDCMLDALSEISLKLTGTTELCRVIHKPRPRKTLNERLGR